MNCVDLTTSDSKTNSSPATTSPWQGKEITVFNCALAGCAIGAGIFGPIGAVIGAVSGAAIGALFFLSAQNPTLATLAKKLISQLDDEKQAVPTVVIEHAAQIVLDSSDSPLSTTDQFWLDEAYAYLSDSNYALPPEFAKKIFERFDALEEEWKRWVEKEASALDGRANNEVRFELALQAVRKHPKLKHYSPEDQRELALKLCTSQSFKDLVWGSSDSLSFDASGMRCPYPKRFEALQFIKAYLYSSSEETPFKDTEGLVKLVYLAIKDKATQNLTEVEKSIKLAYEYFVLKLY